MTLEFLKKEEGWVAEFEAAADFNLHIEGVVEGNVRVYQRGSASGGYALVRSATPYPSYGNVYDFDFSSLIYPKFIKVECATQPSYGEIISSGEVTELKYQDKIVEIVENGEQVVSPDAGFTALNSIKINVNVPQNGEGGGSDEGDLEEYIGFEVYEAGLGDGSTYRYAFIRSQGSNWQERLERDWFEGSHAFSINDGAVYYNGKQLFNDMEDSAWNPSFSNPVMAEDDVVSKTYFCNGGGIGV